MRSFILNYKFDLHGDGIYKVHSNGNTYLGIASGLDSIILKTMDRNSFTEAPGYLWNGKELVPWRIENLFVNNGELVPAGSWIAGKPLTETEYTADLLFNLISFFAAIKKQGVIPQILIPAGIYITEKGGILLFPTGLMNLVAKHQEETFLVNRIEPFNHPDIEGEPLINFFLGVIAYKTFTGELPFTGSTTVEIRDRIRSSKPVPPHLKAPELRIEVSELVMRSINPVRKGASIEEWENFAAGYSKENLFTKADTSPDTGKNNSKALDLERKREKAYQRRQFFVRHGKAIAAAAAALLIAGIILYTPLKKAMEPPVTAGLPSKEVVRLYYDSINNLDTEALDDCTSSKTGKQDIKEVTGIFVISKVRTGYEGKSGLIPAEKWIASGKKPLPPEVSVYGITDLQIKQISENTFTAKYIKWYTEYPQNTEEKNASGIPGGIKVTDRLHLTKIKNAWIIDKIERSTAND